uniref:Uncharacterized protein n=1 Tax=Ananas comosus var. bracteatus TaxID=296719 RepID=A0A6V7QFP1_ANACO|nr:unnamed protein product [Ananas comosus var. bracteatus]
MLEHSRPGAARLGAAQVFAGPSIAKLLLRFWARTDRPAHDQVYLQLKIPVIGNFFQPEGSLHMFSFSVRMLKHSFVEFHHKISSKYCEKSYKFLAKRSIY